MIRFEVAHDPYITRSSFWNIDYNIKFYKFFLTMFPNFREFHYHLSSLYLILNNNDAALESIMNALAVKPDQALYLNRLSFFILILLKRYDEAFFYLEQINVSKCSEVVKNLTLVKYSYLYFATGEYDKSLFYNDKVWFNYPNSFVIQWLRGEALNKVGRHKEAIIHILRAINEQPKNPYTYITLANSYESVGNYEESIICLNKALMCEKLEDRDKIKLSLKQLEEKAKQKT
jgi:tetratricopeptide (TPR) repeat protein